MAVFDDQLSAMECLVSGQAGVAFLQKASSQFLSRFSVLQAKIFESLIKTDTSTFQEFLQETSRNFRTLQTSGTGRINLESSRRSVKIILKSSDHLE